MTPSHRFSLAVAYVLLVGVVVVMSFQIQEVRADLGRQLEAQTEIFKGDGCPR